MVRATMRRKTKRSETRPKNPEREGTQMDAIVLWGSTQWISANRFGDGELTDTENPIEGVANDSATTMGSHSGIGSCPGAAESSTGVR